MAPFGGTLAKSTQASRPSETGASDDAVVRQAGGIVYRESGDKLEFLVISTRGDRRSWIFPKGHIEEGEGDVDCALREVQEEAGVVGAAVATLDPPHRFRSGGEDVVVRYILVQALQDGEPEEGRDKRWVGLEDALVLLSQEEARRLLLHARSLIKRQAPPPDAKDPDATQVRPRPRSLVDEARFPELALAEHGYLARALLASEGRVEQRGLALALVGALVSTGTLGLPSWGRVGALAAALLFGLLLFQQALAAEQTRARLRQGMDRLRRCFVPGEDDPRWHLIQGVDEAASRSPLPVIVLVVAALAGALAAALAAGPGPAPVFPMTASLGAAIVTAGVLGGVAMGRGLSR